MVYGDFDPVNFDKQTLPDIEVGYRSDMVSGLLWRATFSSLRHYQ
jgi:hypothetical protein